MIKTHTHIRSAFILLNELQTISREILLNSVDSCCKNLCVQTGLLWKLLNFPENQFSQIQFPFHYCVLDYFRLVWNELNFQSPGIWIKWWNFKRVSVFLVIVYHSDTSEIAIHCQIKGNSLLCRNMFQWNNRNALNFN